MRFNSIAILTGISLLTCGGCAVPTQRAGDGADYSRYVLSLYNDPGDFGRGGRTLEFPIKAAVAQIGEVAPEPQVVDRLRKASDVFRRVEAIPAPAESGYAARSDPNSPDARQPIRKLQALARDMGLDYVLVYGATVDSQERTTELAVADLTIVGAYVVPSREVAATARASAALIDVRTGRVVLSAGAQASDSSLASAASAGGDSDRLRQQLQHKAFDQLAQQVVEEAQRRNGAIPAIPASADAPARNVPTIPVTHSQGR